MSAFLRHSFVLGLPLVLVLSAGARYRLSDRPLFLDEMGAGEVLFDMQGKQFTIQADTVRLESSVGLHYGISDRLSFEFNYPYLSESQGAFSKSGQGDLITALSYRHGLPRWPSLNWGVRQSLIFPSGFRRELIGFERFTTGRTQSETLVQLEAGDSPTRPADLWLGLHGGLRTDNHVEGTRLLWGASIRYHLLKRRLFIESELAQEMATGNKEATYQFSAGGGGRLPFGFQLRLGVEERVMYNLDRFGLYAGLSWSHQPAVPVRIMHRHLRQGILERLNEKNKVPSFTLEPGAPALLTEAGRLPFLPLRVAILPFDDAGMAPVAQALSAAFSQVVESDTSFQVVSRADLDRVLKINHLTIDQVSSDDIVNLVGRELQADLVLRGKVLAYEPDMRGGPLLAPIMARTHQACHLEAQVWLHQVDKPGPPQTIQVNTLAKGAGRLSLFPVAHGHHEQPGSAVERSRLNRDALERWCVSARESLLYEVSEQLVVGK
jgi:hypothetical protein